MQSSIDCRQTIKLVLSFGTGGMILLGFSGRISGVSFVFLDIFVWGESSWCVKCVVVSRVWVNLILVLQEHLRVGWVHSDHVGREGLLVPLFSSRPRMRYLQKRCSVV